MRKPKKPDIINHKFKAILLSSVLAWFVFLVGRFIDSIYAGNFIGQEALSAVQIVNPLNSLINFFAMLCTAGVIVTYSNLSGKGEKEASYKTVGQSLIISVIVAGLLSLSLYFLQEPILSIFNIKDEVLTYARSYYKWFVFIALILPPYTLFQKLAIQDGDALWPMIANVGLVVMNAVASLLLIQTDLKIEGLGLGSFLSYVMAFLVVMVHYLTKKNSVHIRLGFSIKQALHNFKLGLGQSSTNLYFGILNFSINMFITFKFGSNYLAAYSVVNFIISASAVFVSVPESIGSFLAVANGSNNVTEFKECYKLSKKWAIIVSLASTVLVCSLCLFIPYIFGIKSGEQYEYSWQSCLILPSTFIFTAFIYVYGYANLAKENPYYSIVSLLLNTLVLPIALPIAFSYTGLGFYGIIIGFTVARIISLFITNAIFYFINKPHCIVKIPTTDEIQFSIDCFIEEKDIVRALEELRNKLNEHKVDYRMSTAIIGTVEDMLYLILKAQSTNKKIVEDRFTVCISKDQARIINKNNGHFIDNKIKEEERKNNLSHLYLAAIDKNGLIKLNNVISFNCAMYTLKRRKK